MKRALARLERVRGSHGCLNACDQSLGAIINDLKLLITGEIAIKLRVKETLPARISAFLQTYEIRSKAKNRSRRSPWKQLQGALDSARYFVQQFKLPPCIQQLAHDFNIDTPTIFASLILHRSEEVDPSALLTMGNEKLLTTLEARLRRLEKRENELAIQLQEMIAENQETITITEIQPGFAERAKLLLAELGLEESVLQDACTIASEGEQESNSTRLAEKFRQILSTPQGEKRLQAMENLLNRRLETISKPEFSYNLNIVTRTKNFITMLGYLRDGAIPARRFIFERGLPLALSAISIYCCLDSCRDGYRAIATTETWTAALLAFGKCALKGTAGFGLQMLDTLLYSCSELLILFSEKVIEPKILEASRNIGLFLQRVKQAVECNYCSQVEQPTELTI